MVGSFGMAGSLISYEAVADGVGADDVVTAILAAVPPPPVGIRGAP